MLLFLVSACVDLPRRGDAGISPDLRARILRNGLESSPVTIPSRGAEKSSGPIELEFWRGITSAQVPVVPGGFNCLSSVQLLYARYTARIARSLGFVSDGEMFASARRVGSEERNEQGISGPWVLYPAESADTAGARAALASGIPGLSALLGLHTATWVADRNLTSRGFRIWSKSVLVNGVAMDGEAWRGKLLTAFLGDSFVHVTENEGWAAAEEKYRSSIRAIVRDTTIYLPRDDSVMEVLEPGDIVTAWYPGSDFRERFVTHILICLGRRFGEPVFAEQFGDEGRVTSYTKLVRTHHPFGIENVFRVFAIAPGSSADHSESAVRIEIVKSRRELMLFRNSDVVLRFPIVLGSNPIGPKEREGDGRTPEGDYTVTWKNPRGEMRLDYPNPRDAMRGMEERIIGEDVYERIVQSRESGLSPPQNTPLGGNIFIHGRASDTQPTEGCIALTDTDASILSPLVKVGTVVRILP